MRTISFGQMVMHKRKNKLKKTISFGWMVACKKKEQMERETHILVEWSFANKRNKSMSNIIFGRIFLRKTKERGPYLLVERSFAKEGINDRGPYILVEWLCANKRSKSVRTTIFGRIVVCKRKNKWKRTIHFG